MVMRRAGYVRDNDQIMADLRLRFPRSKVHILQRCYNVWLHNLDLDWHSGDKPVLNQSFFYYNPTWIDMVNECLSRVCCLWAGGQSCIRLVCICDHEAFNSLPASIAVASTLQAVFQHAGFNSIGPLELVSVGLSSRATYAGSASHTCSVEVERGFHVVCPLTSESLVGVRR